MLEQDLYKPAKIFEKEDKSLIIEQKNILTEKIKGIYDKLSPKNDIDTFLNEENEAGLSDEEYQKAKSVGKFKLFFTIKFLGGLLFIAHLVSIYEINSIINAIQEELMASAKSYIKKEKREITDDFYQNFNNINNKLPDYSVFFLSSFLSQYINECMGYEMLTIMASLFNFLTLILGFSKFEFVLDRNNYENYTLNEFIFLYIIYIILCFSQGIIALLPLDIIKDGFIYYDMFNEKTKEIEKNKRENLNINEENDENNNKAKENRDSLINKENNQNEEGQNKKVHKLSGFFLFYLVCITSSIIIKIVIDKTFIGEYKYSSREKVNYYFIVCYLSFTYISLILFRIYSYIVKREKVDNRGENIISSMKIFGYIVYNESKPSEEICCCYSCYNCCELCEDIKVCCQTLNMSLCCYMCSCICCLKTIFCCQCSKCEDNNKVKIRKNEDVNKIERIFVFYRVTGRFNWCAKIMTDIKVYPLALALYFVHITNMGFEDIIWADQEKNEKEYEYIINIIILGAILVFYLINRFGGKCFKPFIEKIVHGDLRDSFNEYSEEIREIFIGFIPYIFIQTIISLIFSGLIYFNYIEISSYLLSITIASVEYIKINILEIISFFIETNYKSLEFFSSSTIFSIYLLIWDIALFLLSLADFDNKYIILFQFIVGLTVTGFFIVLSIITGSKLCQDKNEKNDEQKKEINNDD